MCLPTDLHTLKKFTWPDGYEKSEGCRYLAIPSIWLITCFAGFIGSNLLETLLRHNQRVVGLEIFATGHQCNLDEVRALVLAEQCAVF